MTVSVSLPTVLRSAAHLACGGIALLPLGDLLILQRSEPACPFSRLIEVRSVLEKLRSVRSCLSCHVAVVRRNILAG